MGRRDCLRWASARITPGRHAAVKSKIGHTPILNGLPGCHDGIYCCFSLQSFNMMLNNAGTYGVAHAQEVKSLQQSGEKTNSGAWCMLIPAPGPLPILNTPNMRYIRIILRIIKIRGSGGFNTGGGDLQ